MRLFLALILGIVAHQLQAFPCYITLVKDNCWEKYNVTVNINDANSSEHLATVSVPSGQLWSRQVFECMPSQKLDYKATFSPTFWESDKNKVFSAHHFWSMPQAIAKDTSAWDIKVCYPNDFSEVPLPPDVSGSCACDMEAIPALPPKKI